MVDSWKESWIDETSGEKIFWGIIRQKTEEELKEVKKEWEEYNATKEKDIDKISFETWAECEESDVLHVLEEPKTEDDWHKAALLINIDGGFEGCYAFKQNFHDVPSFKEADDFELSDYSKLRILNLVTQEYLGEEVVSWIFRNDLINELTDKGKISDEEFIKINHLGD